MQDGWRSHAGSGSHRGSASSSRPLRVMTRAQTNSVSSSSPHLTTTGTKTARERVGTSVSARHPPVQENANTPMASMSQIAPTSTNASLVDTTVATTTRVWEVKAAQLRQELTDLHSRTAEVAHEREVALDVLEKELTRHESAMADLRTVWAQSRQRHQQRCAALRQRAAVCAAHRESALQEVEQLKERVKELHRQREAAHEFIVLETEETERCKAAWERTQADGTVAQCELRDVCAEETRAQDVSYGLHGEVKEMVLAIAERQRQRRGAVVQMMEEELTRRELHSRCEDLKGTIRVYCRVKGKTTSWSTHPLTRVIDAGAMSACNHAHTRSQNSAIGYQAGSSNTNCDSNNHSNQHDSENNNGAVCVSANSIDAQHNNGRMRSRSRSRVAVHTSLTPATVAPNGTPNCVRHAQDGGPESAAGELARSCRRLEECELTDRHTPPTATSSPVPPSPSCSSSLSCSCRSTSLSASSSARSSPPPPTCVCEKGASLSPTHVSRRKRHRCRHHDSAGAKKQQHITKEDATRASNEQTETNDANESSTTHVNNNNSSNDKCVTSSPSPTPPPTHDVREDRVQHSDRVSSEGCVIYSFPELMPSAVHGTSNTSGGNHHHHSDGSTSSSVTSSARASALAAAVMDSHPATPRGSNNSNTTVCTSTADKCGDAADEQLTKMQSVCATPLPTLRCICVHQTRANATSTGLCSSTENFTYDRVFTGSSTQQAVYDDVEGLVENAVDGYHVCIFAYGQTGSGKTYTMEGNLRHSGAHGITPRAVRTIFRRQEELAREGWEYQFSCSFVEIYNEAIRDLLQSASMYAEFGGRVGMVGGSSGGKNSSSSNTSAGHGGYHTIQHHEDGSTSITNVRERPIRTLDEFTAIHQQAVHNRRTAKTQMNERSSRSHCIFVLNIRGHNETIRQRVHGVLCLVDLAGSERVHESGAHGQQLREAIYINKSLLDLGKCINALRTGAVVAWRNSKLTYLLQNYMRARGGKILMLVTVSDRSAHLPESLNSLRFAKRVAETMVGPATKRVTTY